MNRQNDDNFEELTLADEENDESFTSDEKSTGSESIKDEISDYVFMKPHRSKKYYSKPRGSVKNEDIMLVKSDRNSRHRSKHKSKRKMKLWKKILISFICVILALVLIAVGSFTFLVIKGSDELLDDDYNITAPQGVEVQNDGEYIVYNGKTYELNTNVTSMLFMGIDKRALDQSEVNGTGGQADVIVLIAVDTKTSEITMLNISRDTMTDVTLYSANGGYVGTETQQICLAYAYGDGMETSCENTVNSVKRLFYNIPIKSYLALDLDGIAAVNDSVGGVDVVSPETIGSFTQGESYHLLGDMAEKFVRTRSHESAEANTLRMQRQQEYVNKFMNKVISQTKQDITTPISLFNASSPYTCTNLNPSKVCYLAQSAVMSNGMSVNMLTVPGEAKMDGNYAQYYVDETQFYEMFLSVYYSEVK